MAEVLAPVMSANVNPPLYEGLDYDDRIKCCSSRASMTSAESEATSETRTELSESNEEPTSELPPSYTPALTQKGILQMKPELSSPFCRSRYRSWRACLVEVNNTQLKLTYQQFGGLITKTHTFSLQFAEVGLATDYEKRPNSFRLRVETRQLMFDCANRQEMLSWMVSLQMAISLALPLELRQLPEEVKRRRNRQRDRERHRAREQNRRRLEQQESQSQTHTRAHTHSSSHSHTHSNSRKSRKSESGTSSNRLSQDPSCIKWEPARRSSRFSEKDFPHLLMNTTWEGKSVIYQGKWAQINNREITFVIAHQTSS